jgi:hypothetical protein
MFQPMQRDSVRFRSDEKAGQLFGTGGKVKKFSGLQIKMWGEIIHCGSASARNGFRRARLRPIICLACARQGCPKLTKALRAGGLFCGSTVDQHRPDRDLALKDCAPGIPCRKMF